MAWVGRKRTRWRERKRWDRVGCVGKPAAHGPVPTCTPVSLGPCGELGSAYLPTLNLCQPTITGYPSFLEPVPGCLLARRCLYAKFTRFAWCYVDLHKVFIRRGASAWIGENDGTIRRFSPTVCSWKSTRGGQFFEKSATQERWRERIDPDEKMHATVNASPM